VNINAGKIDTLHPYIYSRRALPISSFLSLRSCLLLLFAVFYLQSVNGQELKPLGIKEAEVLPDYFSPANYPVSLVIIQFDTLGSIADYTEKKAPLLERSLSTLKENLPEIYEEQKKYKLKLKIPWRENDLVIPFPKGFTQQPNPPPFDPAVAYQRSAIFPGWGQAYNQSYWKIPIFYAGYGGFVWWINYNNGLYRRFGTAFLLANDGIVGNEDTELSERFDTAGLRTQRNQYRSRRDNAFLLLAGWHIVQIAEAYVHAHLKGFDVSEDLGMKAFPDVLQLDTGFGSTGFYPGFSFQFKF